MITDARVLQPEFVPRDVVHRNAEVYALSGALEPITRGEPGETAFLSGPSGAGKTCIARYAVTQLSEEVLDLKIGYVNCWGERTRFKVLYRVLEAFDNALDIHRQSTPTDALVDRLHDRDGPPAVVILDEVDQLEESTALYDLTRTPGLTLVLIANHENRFYNRLDQRPASRLRSATSVRFDPYGEDALVSILEDRVRWGLRADAVTTEQLAQIADGAAGDARVAIETLRAAARRAQHEHSNHITDTMIEAAVPEAKTELRQKSLDRLNEHQQMLYDIITEQEAVEPQTLYTEYRGRVDDPKSERMLRNYLRKLRQYNLIEAEGQTRGRIYRAIG